MMMMIHDEDAVDDDGNVMMNMFSFQKEPFHHKVLKLIGGKVQQFTYLSNLGDPVSPSSKIVPCSNNSILTLK